MDNKEQEMLVPVLTASLPSLMDELNSIEDCLKVQRQCGIVREEPEYYEIGMPATMSNVDPISDKLSSDISRLKAEILSNNEESPQRNSALASLLHLVGYSYDPERLFRKRIIETRSLLDRTLSRRLPNRQVYAIGYRSRLPFDYSFITKGPLANVLLPSRVFDNITERHSNIEMLCRRLVEAHENVVMLSKAVPPGVADYTTMLMQTALKVIVLDRDFICGNNELYRVVRLGYNTVHHFDVHYLIRFMMSSGDKRNPQLGIITENQIRTLKEHVSRWDNNIFRYRRAYAHLPLGFEETEAEARYRVEFVEALENEVISWNDHAGKGLFSHQVTKRSASGDLRIDRELFDLRSVTEMMASVLDVKIVKVGSIIKGRSSSVGGFSDVYQVELNMHKLSDEEHELLSACSMVAVKVLRRDKCNEQDLCLNLVREVRIWSKLRNEHIVPFLGLCVDSTPDLDYPGLASPWMDCDLQSFIKAQPEASVKQRLSYLVNVADALSYMHNHYYRFIHGDIKANNVLIRGEQAYLSDFGTSCMLYDIEDFESNIAGTSNWRWKAPEFLLHRLEDATVRLKPTQEGDMYAFGCLFLETFTGKLPWSGLTDSFGIQERFSNKIATPSRPRQAIPNDKHWFFVTDCWKESPTLRPRARTALKLLMDFLRDEKG